MCKLCLLNFSCMSTKKAAVKNNIVLKPRGWSDSLTVSKELGYKRHNYFLELFSNLVEGMPKDFIKTSLPYKKGQYLPGFFLSKRAKNMIEIKSSKPKAKIATAKVIIAKKEDTLSDSKTLTKHNELLNKVITLVDTVHKEYTEVKQEMKELKVEMKNLKNVEIAEAKNLAVAALSLTEENNKVFTPNTKKKINENRSLQNYKEIKLEILRVKGNCTALVNKLFGNYTSFANMWTKANSAINEKRYRDIKPILTFGDIKTTGFSDDPIRLLASARLHLQDAHDYHTRLILIDDDRNGTLAK